MQEDFLTMTVLITGGTGFIGSRLALKCMERGDRVTVFSKVNNAVEEENRVLLEKVGVNVVVGSMTDKRHVHKICEGIDVIFHLAAAQHEVDVPDQVFRDVNVEGTRNLLETAEKAAIKRFVHGSTIGVFGERQDLIHEDGPCNPENIYGITKLEGENVVRSFRKRLPVVIIRISETYGPGDRRLLKLFRAIKKRLFFMIGSGKNLHQPIYVNDLIDGLFRAVEKNEAIGKTFLLVGNQQITTKEMVDTIAGQLQVKYPRFSLPLFPLMATATILEKILRPLAIQPPLHKRRMDFFRKSFYFSETKSSKLLGFHPKTNFEQGVMETAKWYQKARLL